MFRRYMSVALNERKEIHDRVEKYLDTAGALSTLPPTKSLPKHYIPGRIPNPKLKNALEVGHRNFIYDNSSTAMKVVWWIRYHPIAIAGKTDLIVKAIIITSITALFRYKLGWAAAGCSFIGSATATLLFG